MTLAHDGQQALGALFWRTEILQAMYWMHGEGIASEIDAARLAEFLAADTHLVSEQILLLVLDGYLESVGGSRFALTRSGVAEGGRSFADEFADLTRAAHYECAPGCWCHDPDHIGEPCPSQPKPEPAQPPPDAPDPDAEARRGH